MTCIYNIRKRVRLEKWAQMTEDVGPSNTMEEEYSSKLTFSDSANHRRKRK